MFIDHNEDCHGVIDSKWMREECPENFYYTCCKGDGYSERCKEKRHVEKKSVHKRARY